GEGRLGDVVARLSGNLSRELMTLLRGGMRTDQHAVASGFVGGFDHELVEIVEHVLAVFGAPAQVGGDVEKNRLFALVVLDHVGHVGVNDLIVGDAVAGCVGKGNFSRSVGFHQAGNAE